MTRHLFSQKQQPLGMKYFEIQYITSFLLKSTKTNTLIINTLKSIKCQLIDSQYVP